MGEVPLHPGRRWFQKGEHVALAKLRDEQEAGVGAMIERCIREIRLEMRANGYEPEEDYEVFIRVTRAGMPRERRGQAVTP